MSSYNCLGVFFNPLIGAVYMHSATKCRRASEGKRHQYVSNGWEEARRMVVSLLQSSSFSMFLERLRMLLFRPGSVMCWVITWTRWRETDGGLEAGVDGDAKNAIPPFPPLLSLRFQTRKKLTLFNDFERLYNMRLRVLKGSKYLHTYLRMMSPRSPFPWLISEHTD